LDRGRARYEVSGLIPGRLIDFPGGHVDRGSSISIVISRGIFAIFRRIKRRDKRPNTSFADDRSFPVSRNTPCLAVTRRDRADILTEPEAEAIAGRLDGARLVASNLLAFELANVRLLKCRRHPDQHDALLTAFQLRRRSGVEEIEIDHAGALALAEAAGLTAYDASYLWLANRLEAELVTLDRALARAAAVL
jgi:predicted nucleic acid-binding protein